MVGVFALPFVVHLTPTLQILSWSFSIFFHCTKEHRKYKGIKHILKKREDNMSKEHIHCRRQSPRKQEAPRECITDGSALPGVERRPERGIKTRDPAALVRLPPPTPPHVSALTCCALHFALRPLTRKFRYGKGRGGTKLVDGRCSVTGPSFLSI